jgi:hypothetical protein
MPTRYTAPALAAAVLVSSFAIGQSSAQTQPGVTGQDTTLDETPITLVGCLQREADYRRTHDLGRGGVVGTGAGRGNEYVLINASRTESGASADIDCSSEASAEAYELTGNRERDLEPFVGRAVQISGMLKQAEVEAVGTSGRTRPTGGVDPLGQDLRLHEVNVTSFQQVSAPAPVSVAAQTPSVPAAEPQPAPTTGAEPQLPRTAGPLPLAGLIGLLSFGGALGLRVLRRA